MLEPVPQAFSVRSLEKGLFMALPNMEPASLAALGSSAQQGVYCPAIIRLQQQGQNMQKSISAGECLCSSLYGLECIAT